MGEPESKQLFYYDDFLGQTSAGDKLSKNEDQRLLNLIETCSKSKNRRFILTTRDYILAQAKRAHEVLDRADLDTQKFILSLEDYSKIDKAKILANHLYFQNVPPSHIEAIVATKGYEPIIKHPNYNPRIIAALTETKILEGIEASKYPQHFLQMLDNPTEIWDHVFRNRIGDASRHLLFVLATCGTEVAIEDLRAAFLSFHNRQADNYRTTNSPTDFETSLKELESNFVKIVRYASTSTAAFHNPSIADFISGHFRSHPDTVVELLQAAIYFEQPLRVVALVSPNDGATDAKRAEQHLQALEPHLRRAFSTTFMAPSITLTYKYSPDRPDMKKAPNDPIERMRQGIALSTRLQTKGFATLIRNLCKTFFSPTHLSPSTIWASHICSLLDDLEGSGQHKAAELAAWKRASLPVVLSEPEDMEEALASSLWIGSNRNHVSDDQFRTFSSKVEAMTIDMLRSMESEGDLDVLESALSDAKNIENALGFAIQDEIAELENQIDEIKKENEKEDNVSSWDSSSRVTTDDSAEAIASIFESLL